MVFKRLFVKRFALCYRTVVLSCLSVTFMHCGQTKLGIQVGLGPGHIVLDGDQAPPPQFLAHICCGQMAAWIKMPLGMEVGLSPGYLVLDGDPAPSPIFSQFLLWPPLKRAVIRLWCGVVLLWPNGWMHQEATWYGGRLCVEGTLC